MLLIKYRSFCEKKKHEKLYFSSFLVTIPANTAKRNGNKHDCTSEFAETIEHF